MRFDEIGVEADAMRGRIDVSARLSQHGPRLVVQEVDADLVQDVERGLMDRFELVTRDKVEQRERRLWLAQGLSEARASAALDRTPAAAPGIVRRRIRRHEVPQIPARRRPKGRDCDSPLGAF